MSWLLRHEGGGQSQYSGSLRVHDFEVFACGYMGSSDERTYRRSLPLYTTLAALVSDAMSRHRPGRTANMEAEYDLVCASVGFQVVVLVLVLWMSDGADRLLVDYHRGQNVDYQSPRNRCTADGYCHHRPAIFVQETLLSISRNSGSKLVGIVPTRRVNASTAPGLRPGFCFALYTHSVPGCSISAGLKGRPIPSQTYLAADNASTWEFPLSSAISASCN